MDPWLESQQLTLAACVLGTVLGISVFSLISSPQLPRVLVYSGALQGKRGQNVKDCF